MPIDIDALLQDAPDNFVIQNALEKCVDVVSHHQKIMCSVSGGADSDVMLDMLLRCGARGKTDFVFFNTGLEYHATLEHLDDLEKKYNIKILREKPQKSIPQSVKEFGVPFWSKFVSEYINRFQSHTFQWDDLPYKELVEKYPKCKSAINWWCNRMGGDQVFGKTTQYVIERAPYLKEFMIANHPTFKVSSKCCQYAKKEASKQFEKAGGYDLKCMGVRKAEGGARATAFKNCFSEGHHIDNFRPIWWFRDSDRAEYCAHYGVVHSRCYTEYGLVRTGCVGCPFGKRFEDELSVIKAHEPKLYAAALAVFGPAYDYTRRYLEYREKKKQEAKSKPA